MDKNEEELLTLEEIKNKTTEWESHHDHMNDKFNKIDINEDGFLDLNEFVDWASARHSNKAGEHFEILDTDADDLISEEEFWARKRN